MANSIFSDEIFCGIMTLKFWSPCWRPKVGHQDGRSIHLLLKVSNTHLPATLKRNAFGLQTLAQMCRFNPLQFHKHFVIKICYFMLLNFNMTSVHLMVHAPRCSHEVPAAHRESFPLLLVFT